MKAPATVYKGIEFVVLSELPAEQQFLLQHELKIERIKILIDEKIISNCIQYKHYEAWYVNSFEPAKPVSVVRTETQPLLPTSLVLNKA